MIAGDGKRRHPPKFERVVAVLLAVSLLQAAAPPDSSHYDVNTSTTTAHPKRRRPLRRLRAAGDRMFTPGRNLQRPSTGPMPPQRPLVPAAPVITPPSMPKMPAAERFLRGAAKIMTHSWGDNIFVFLPAVSTDPNTGPTYGILPVLVLAEPVHHHIQQLFAPSYTYNELFGQTFTGRYYYYPTDASQFYGTGSYSTRTNRELKARYLNTEFLGGRAFIQAEGWRNIDGSLRFYGIGPETHEGDQAGYVGYESLAHVSMGVNFQDVYRASFGVRYRHMNTGTNVVENVNNLQTSFPTLNGLGPQTTVTQEVRLLLDSRDLPVTPSRGSSAEIFGEKTDLGWGSDSDFIRYGIEGKHYFPWSNPNQLTIIHGLYDWVNGPNIPFYELASLGGRDTLRAYGAGRFNDNGRLLFNIEQRTTVASLPLMGVQTKFEVGPFFDIGTVFPRADEIQRKNFTPVYGAAFRAAVKPNVVGSVDVGIGKEGPGVFVGIDYPF